MKSWGGWWNIYIEKNSFLSLNYLIQWKQATRLCASIVGQSLGCHQYNFSEISWEAAHKGLVVELKRNAGNGLCHPALLSGWFQHQGAHRASPRDIVGFNALFILLAAWANSHHRFHCEFFFFWSQAQVQRTCAWDQHLAAHLEWLSAFAFFPSRHFPAFGDWKAMLNTLCSKSWFLLCWPIKMRDKTSTPKYRTQVTRLR